MKTITFDETKWKLVPIEPTKEMEKSAFLNVEINHFPGFNSGTEARNSIYYAMLSAAPEYKPEADEDGFVQCDGRPPVSGDVLVDIKFSNGAVVLSERAEAWDWCKDGGLPYIVAYRIAK